MATKTYKAVTRGGHRSLATNLCGLFRGNAKRSFATQLHYRQACYPIHKASESTTVSKQLRGRRIKYFGTTAQLTQDDTVKITFIDRDGDKRTVTANVGDSLLDVAKDNDIDVEGACEGTLACSTCHLIFDPKQFNEVELEPPSEEELDMLDLAFGLTETSRLGCQIIVTKEFDGLVLTLPVGTSDARLR